MNKYLNKSKATMSRATKGKEHDEETINELK